VGDGWICCIDCLGLYLPLEARITDERERAIRSRIAFSLFQKNPEFVCSIRTLLLNYNNIRALYPIGSFLGLGWLILIREGIYSGKIQPISSIGTS